ncbi:PaaI family thioesterase [Natrarchaeobius chitinivorans]|uniref:PaaI family thioesterase n=1 Tax=Natrarchaeobius chitinivorans TaxID=1679083 RepID=A0A3N6P9A0_NATCH|nr:PaaI family thioesterase [Natrarchaeobius chitinivorans]RQG95449.1 PaaI family thioesterase [Natrarchaeobius chitinivorans]
MTSESVDQDIFEQMIDQHGFLANMDIEHVRTDRGRTVLSMPYNDDIANTFQGSSGSLHGGALATLIDAGCGFALRSTFDDPIAAGLATTDLSVTYVSPATTNLRLVATVVRAGGAVGFAEATIKQADTNDDQVVARGDTTYRIFRDTDD